MQKQRKIEQDFVKKIQKHQGILHKISYIYSDNSADKEDLYQEMVLQLWKSYTSFREESKFSTWMYRVALNTAITLNKKKSFFKTVDTDTKSFVYEDHAELSDEINTLYKAIAKLNKIEKAIILLWLEERSYQEISDIIGISVKNVSVKIVRSKKKLAKIIKNIS